MRAAEANHDAPTMNVLASRVFAILDERLLRSGRWGLRVIYRRRARAELDQIEKRGLAGFFDTIGEVAAFINKGGWACGPGSGRACGSLVCWALGATSVDPVSFDLPQDGFLYATCGRWPLLLIEVEPAALEPTRRFLCTSYGSERVVRSRSSADAVPTGASLLPIGATIPAGPFVLRGAQRRIPGPSLHVFPCPELLAFRDFRWEMLDQRILAPLTGPYLDPEARAVFDLIRVDDLESLAAALALGRTRPEVLERLSSYLEARAGGASEMEGLPGAEDVLRTTYGTLVYQEQFVSIVGDSLGLGYEDAERLRYVLAGGGAQATQARKELRESSAVAAGFADRLARMAPALASRCHFLSSAMRLCALASSRREPRPVASIDSHEMRLEIEGILGEVVGDTYASTMTGNVPDLSAFVRRVLDLMVATNRPDKIRVSGCPYDEGTCQD